MIKSKSFSEEYKRVLHDALFNTDFEIKPRGKVCKELYAGQICIDPYSCFFNNSRRDYAKILKYLVGETIWYFNGRNDLKFIEKYASFWKHICNIDETCNSAYGNLLFTLADGGHLSNHDKLKVVTSPEVSPEVLDSLRQELASENEHIVTNFDWHIETLKNSGISQWVWAYESLKSDKDSRQAIMHFNRPSHQYADNKDFVCTMYANFHIRNDKLYLISRMRSQDIIRGMTYDIPFFAMLLQNMHLLLKRVYPELECGNLIHSADSLHIYSEHFDLGVEMLREDFQDIQIKLPNILVDEQGCAAELLLNINKLELDCKYDEIAELLGVKAC